MKAQSIRKQVGALQTQLDTNCVKEQDELRKVIDRIERHVGTLKHDLNSKLGLRGTIHPDGFIELSCQLHTLALEIKTKQALIDFLGQLALTK